MLTGKEIPPTCRRKNAEALTKKEYEVVSTESFENLENVKRLKIQKNFRNILKRLISKGHFLEIITERRGRELDFVKEWLRINNVNIPIKNNPHNLQKYKLCKGLDVFVEDMPYQIKLIKKIVPKIIMFNVYDNKEDVLTKKEKEMVKGIKRISDWKQFKL